MYAIIEFKGKQYKAEKGTVLTVDKIEAEPGSALNIETVLLISGEGASDSSVKVGAPYLKGVKVSAVVEAHKKARKVIVFKYKPKKDYRRKQGHRQQYSMIRIQDIVGA